MLINDCYMLLLFHYSMPIDSLGYRDDEDDEDDDDEDDDLDEDEDDEDEQF